MSVSWKEKCQVHKWEEAREAVLSFQNLTESWRHVSSDVNVCFWENIEGFSKYFKILILVFMTRTLSPIYTGSNKQWYEHIDNCLKKSYWTRVKTGMRSNPTSVWHNLRRTIPGSIRLNKIGYISKRIAYQ